MPVKAFEPSIKLFREQQQEAERKEYDKEIAKAMDQLRAFRKKLVENQELIQKRLKDVHSDALKRLRDSTLQNIAETLKEIDAVLKPKPEKPGKEVKGA